MSRRGTAEEKTAKSDPIYRNRLVNMLVNRILKHGKKSLAYQIIYRAMKKIQQNNSKYLDFFRTGFPILAGKGGKRILNLK
ncbi:hypothetical protein C4D60_Mb00t13840 [Musa balbisiana]|uniref:Small ribosomal subunit protein uS7 domain-containing protein n=1 Tax=Musa balbisiana TaxID=52838 RepID=A0A4S8I2D7_MUSBA|nr:hypothetical protein C4D60_Mb00t13840 [Musa balbisiana]